MRVLKLPSTSAAASAAADLVAETLRAPGAPVLGLPTGMTVVPLYRALVQRHQAGRADFKRALTFNVDEYVGLHAGHPGSYGAFMRKHLFQHVNMAPSRIHMPRSSAKGWREAIARFERRLAEAGGLDLVVVGIGLNGHLAFNEPGPRLVARTHRVRLSVSTRRRYAVDFGDRWQNVPTHALSMGIGTILSARRVVLLALGSHKAAIVQRALSGPVTTRVPASLLQVHPDAVVVLDRAAAAKLSGRARRGAAGQRPAGD